jgi:hypothetical protein
MCGRECVPVRLWWVGVGGFAATSAQQDDSCRSTSHLWYNATRGGRVVEFSHLRIRQAGGCTLP